MYKTFVLHRYMAIPKQGRYIIRIPITTSGIFQSSLNREQRELSTNRTDVLTTAFINPDGKVAVVVMNKGDKTLPYRLWIAGKAVEAKALPHSIATLIL